MTIYTPPVNTYTPLASITLASATSSVTLTGFSQDYRDLVCVVNGTTDTTRTIILNFNGDTGTYETVIMQSGESVLTPASETVSSTTALIGRLRATMSSMIFQVMDYSATDKDTIVLSRSNATDFTVRAYAARWDNTAAVNSLEIATSGGNFASGSTFKLFGIKA